MIKCENGLANDDMFRIFRREYWEELRDFIAQWDENYAYNKGKTRLMEQQAQKEFFSPLPNDFNVKAITDDGTIVTKHNILDYMHEGCLVI